MREAVRLERRLDEQIARLDARIDKVLALIMELTKSLRFGEKARTRVSDDSIWPAAAYASIGDCGDDDEGRPC
jgi:hypothetical protein